MKYFLLISAFFLLNNLHAQDDREPISEQDSVEVEKLEDVEVSAVRWKNKTLTPATTYLGPKQIEKVNVGLSLPQALQQVPSLIYSSDAGNNVGYSNMKIRGSDATRINVTINGVPFNDAESQATYFVDIADIISSTKDIQITNGIGSSSNGTGALGASMSINTGNIEEKSEVVLNSGIGYYNTMRNSLKISSGRIGRYKANIRLSAINSDGYVERASSLLRSWQINQALDISDKHEIKLLTFGAKEVTGQAWEGVSIETFDTMPKSNFIGQINDTSYYNNQVDDYTQNHIQLFINSSWTPSWTSSLGFYSTSGKGYYEEYKKGQKYSDYHLSDIIIDSTHIISTTDMVRQLWLKNRLVGANFIIQYKDRNNSAFKSNVIGLGFNRYDGEHYGLVKWAQNGGVPVDWEWYNNNAIKYDANIYDKAFFSWSSHFTLGLDMQVRAIDYSIKGFRDNPSLNPHLKYTFFNPKVSISSANHSTSIGKYDFNAFIGRSSKEPIRADFENSPDQLPVPESVIDLEIGNRLELEKGYIKLNLFNLEYRYQLVLTGKLNDVGAYTRQNVARSFRRGAEIVASFQLGHQFTLDANYSFMNSKIKQYLQYYYDYDSSIEISQQYDNVDISYSPKHVAYVHLSKNFNIGSGDLFEIGIRMKGVSKQYLDNTENADRSMPAYSTMDLLTSYSFGPKHISRIYAQFLNVFNNSYYSNGYSYYYKYGGELQNVVGVYPQATFNILLGIQVQLQSSKVLKSM